MRQKAFTLIELLIVVAIIAILAAIAVPNFLEAQVRSKTSRVKADQRSLATAIEAYYVDNNSYPACDSSDWVTAFGANGLPTASAGLISIPTFRLKQTSTDNLSTLTTPISYITSYFTDPFASTPGAIYMYSTPSFSYAIEVQKAGWVVSSYGPDADETDPNDNVSGDFGYINYNLPNTRVNETWYNPYGRTPSAVALQKGNYDPTNGSVSNGDIYRFKQ